MDWQRISVSAKVPDNTSRIRIYCNLRYASGTVTINGQAGAYDNAEIWSEETTAPEAEEIQPATYYETVTETAPNDSITTYDDYCNVIKTEGQPVLCGEKNIGIFIR